MKTKILPILIITALLVSCSQENGKAVDPEQFEAFLKLKRIPMNDESRVTRMQSEYLRRQALASAISNTEVLDQAMVNAEIEEFRKELLISRYFESFLADAVSEQGIQNYYSSNIDTYKTRKAKVSHILFRVNPRMGEPERQAALTSASAAYSKITSGEAFDEVAGELSQDKVSAKKGGDLGWINEGAISQAFSDKVFAMQAGDVSEPFLSDYGFHVIKLMQAPQDVVKPLEAVKGDIRYQLRSEVKKAEMDRLLQSAGLKPQDEAS